jgi:cobalt-zinc-cadmium efflux system protein
MFDGVPANVNLADVRTYLESLSGVVHVHDLHVWAMGTSQIALSVHLVMPHGSLDDAFLEDVADTLHDRFEIVHPTIQIEKKVVNHGCQ